MPKQLINLLGVLATIAILGLAIALVAMPIYFQSLATTAQTTQVAGTNAIYQTQVDMLTAESERMDEIQASLAGLRVQLPAANELDGVFELVAQAADGAGVTVESITAGENSGFVVRTDALAIGEQPDSGTSAEPADGTAEDTTDGTEDTATQAVAADGRQQIDFAVSVTATDLGAIVQFLDNLRVGPRLLSSIQSTVTATGTGFDADVSALTFVLPEN